MFWNKNKNKEPEVAVEVESIPAEFYGGINPTVNFKTATKEVDLKRSANITAPEKRAFDKTTAVGSKSKLHLANLLTSPKFLFLAVGGLFIVFSGVVGIYYWRQSLVAKPVAVVPVPENIVKPTATVVEQPPVVTTTEETTVTTTPVPPVTPESILAVPPVYPPMTLGESVDTDNDGVTDKAEELFLTDPGLPDTDKDKHSDSQELYNLYNPIGKEPLKLIDSGLVLDFLNPVFGYKVYYPKTWAVGNVDPDYRDMLFSTLTGESVEIRAIEKTSVDETFADWFAQWAPTEKIGDLKPFSTVFKDKGWQRSDELVFYFETPRRVYVLLYHTTDSTVVNYKIVIKMMARSFRLPLSNDIIPPPINEQSGAEATMNTSSPIVTTSTNVSTTTATTSSGI